MKAVAHEQDQANLRKVMVVLNGKLMKVFMAQHFFFPSWYFFVAFSAVPFYSPFC